MIKTWWPLALAGTLNALYAIANLLALNSHMHQEMVVALGTLALAAGLCTVAAGLWNGRLWLLMLNGLALSAIGSLFLVWATFSPEKPHSFLSIGLLLAVMALSAAILEWNAARRSNSDRWLLSSAGAAEVVFALAFLVMALRWIRLEPETFTVCLSSFFAFSAVSMLWAALRFRNNPIGGQFN
jgi:hypothetical protein